MNKDLIKYLVLSCLIIVILPYLAISFATSLTGLGIAIMLFMAVLPVYFIVSPLTVRAKPIVIALIPILNAFLFLLSVRITFNNSADSYLIVYIPLAYLAILIKFVYMRYKAKL
ncbi:MAG: hypothetical protein NC408_00255 [Candidatus Gastranaerophilales bacterium]|nr:hypothetical protein [Candidatus Gastranaerophilales bacterium]MCM1073067.1 hypothetical protein [Bacteroides sp.]